MHKTHSEKSSGHTDPSGSEFPKVFCNPDIESRLAEGKRINKKQLINYLNYINFQDSTILLTFKHHKYNKTITFNTKPQPCMKDTLECLWTKSDVNNKLASYQFQYLLLSDGLRLIMAKADVEHIGEEGIGFSIPETCYEVGSRKTRRHSCENVPAEIIQNGILFTGFLRDFSAVAFKVEMSTSTNRSFQWINPDQTLSVMLKNGHGILYSGECRIIRGTPGSKSRTFVLEPLNNPVLRTKAKDYRGMRQKLSPSPTVVFRHPFTKKAMNLKVNDISSSGFSVEEDEENSVLLLGMIIPDVEMDFAGGFRINFKAQVVYRKVFQDRSEKSGVKCGLVILDIEISDHTRLSALLHQAKDENSYLCNKVDIDSLWNFLFETGFVYPQKYVSIQTNKEAFRENFERLYTQNSDIARHFVYQERGRIYGHLSMIHIYENSWLIHHHAAKTSTHNSGGVAVLRQFNRYLSDFQGQYPEHIKFIICYFRPDNKFPNRVFGGFEKSVKDRRICSIDPFAYFFHQRESLKTCLPDTWSLTETQPEDLFDLESFYGHESGGLMIQALDLEPGTDSLGLDVEYHKLGLKRERLLFSLKKENRIKAVFMLSITDIGLNMSDLTNCIHAVLTDPEDVPKEILNSSLSLLSGRYPHDEIPVLLYPVEYAKSQSIPYDKIYNLWILNMQHLGHYLRHIEKTFRRQENTGDSK